MFGRYAIFKSNTVDYTQYSKADTTILSDFIKKVKKGEQQRSFEEAQENRRLILEYETRFADLLNAFANMKDFCKIIEDVKKFTDSYDYIEYRNCEEDSPYLYKPEFEIRPYYSCAEKERLNPKDDPAFCYDITKIMPQEIKSKLKHISVPMVYMQKEVFFSKVFSDSYYISKNYTGPFKYINAVNDDGTLNNKIFEYKESAEHLSHCVHVHSNATNWDIELPFDEGGLGIETRSVFTIIWFAFFQKYLKESFKLYGTAILWDSVLDKFYTLKK
jgi:hypothetical protein